MSGSAPRPDPGAPRWGFAVAAGAIAVLWLALYGPQIVGREVFVRGDATAFQPFSDFSRERWLTKHERTFWNPYVFAGLPAAASLADTRPQYLPDPLLDAYEAPGRLPGWPDLLPVLLAHLAGMLATAWLARALWSAGPWGTAWAGAAFGLATNVALPVTYGHDAQAIAVGLMPVAVLATHALTAAAVARGAWRALAGFAVLSGTLGLAGLTGHPQYVAYTYILVLAFTAERAWHLKQLSRVVLVVAACALGVLISAAVWWPAFLYGQDSVRAGPWGGVGLAEVARYSLPPGDKLSLVWPWAVGFGEGTYWGGLHLAAWPPYLGVTVLVLAVVGVWPARRAESEGRERSTIAFWAVTALVGLVLAFGTHLGAFYVFLHEHVPFWSKFRVALGTLVFTHLGLALLSARGVERVLESVAAPGALGARRDPVLVAAVVLLILCIPVGLASEPLQNAYARLVQTARPFWNADLVRDASVRAVANGVGTLVLLGCVMLVVGGARRVAGPRAWLLPLTGALLTVLLVTDLIPHDLGVIRASAGPPRMLEAPPPPALARVLAVDPSVRGVHTDRPLFFTNDWVSWRARSLGGLHGAAPLRWDELRGRDLFGRYSIMCAFGLRYIASDSALYDHPELFERVSVAGAANPAGRPGPGVWRLLHALPRAYPVSRVLAPGNDEAVVHALGSGDFVPNQVAYTADRSAAGEYAGSVVATGRWLVDDPDRLELEVTAPDRSFLVVADAWFPGWRADLDGRPVTIHRVNHMLRGVAVPAGRHVLAMRYEPPGWRVARDVTFGALAVCAFLALGAVALRARPRS